MLRGESESILFIAITPYIFGGFFLIIFTYGLLGSYLIELITKRFSIQKVRLVVAFLLYLLGGSVFILIEPINSEFAKISANNFFELLITPNVIGAVLFFGMDEWLRSIDEFKKKKKIVFLIGGLPLFLMIITWCVVRVSYQ